LNNSGDDPLLFLGQNMIQITKTISAQAFDRVFETPFHFVVRDKEKKVYAASVIGYLTQTRGLFASMVEERLLKVDAVTHGTLKGGNYRRIERSLNDDVVHTIILHKSAFYNELVATDKDVTEDEKEVYPLILATDGDLSTAAGKYLAARFGLADEWIDQYYSILPSDWIEELEVVVNQDFPLYTNAKAVRLRIKEKDLLSVITKNLKNGVLAFPNSSNGIHATFDPSMTMKEYLRQNAKVLSEQINRIRPHFVPSQDQLHWSIRTMARTPFPVQAWAIQGFTNAILAGEQPINGGDMGVGKSIQALGVAHVLYHVEGQKPMPVLLSTPGMVLSKWIDDEIRPTLPYANTRIINSSNDALKLVREVKAGWKPDGLTFFLVSMDRAKFGNPHWFAGVWKSVRRVSNDPVIRKMQEADFLSVIQKTRPNISEETAKTCFAIISKNTKTKAWHCPECTLPITVKVEEEGKKKSKSNAKDADEFECAGWHSFAKSEVPLGAFDNSSVKTAQGLPESVHVEWDRIMDNCPHCKSSLWRPALKTRGETDLKPRWPIARILRRLKKWFRLFIQDELHMTRAEGSGRGYAFGQLVKTAKSGLYLTGTMTNGKSSSIKEILWRTTPKQLLDDGFDHKTGAIAWANRYGTLKQIVKVEDNDKGKVTRRKQTALQPTEAPGISPAMTATHLLHRSVFIELGDLNLPTTQMKEIPVFLDLDDEHKKEYRNLHEELFQRARVASFKGIKNAFATFTAATLNYADQPHLGARYVIKGVDGVEDEIVRAKEFQKSYKTAKERWLIETVRNELAEDRCCLIYNTFTGEYKQNERIRDVLRVIGIDAVIMDTKVKQDERKDWLKSKAKEGAKVVITAASLMQVGLDALEYPTIICYQLPYPYNIDMLRQSVKRHHRIGQTRECRTYYPVYNGTTNMHQFMDLMRKRGSALMTEGRLDKSELNKYCRDINTALAQDLANCLAGTEVADAWKILAEKDIDERIEQIAEADFRKVLNERLEQLKEETLSLCEPIPAHYVSPVSTGTVDTQVIKQARRHRATLKDAKSGQEKVRVLDHYELFEVKEVTLRSRKEAKLSPAVGQLGFDFGF